MIASGNVTPTAPVDSSLTPGPPAANANMMTMAVIRPFTERDADMMLSPMDMPTDEWLNSCKSKGSWDVIDLIFYYNKNLDGNPELMQRLQSVGQRSHVKRCFHNVKYISAQLSEEEDGYPRGCCNQFFKMFLDNEMREAIGSYGSVYVMEPDVTPLKNAWLDRLYDHANWAHSNGIWVSGPTYDSREVPADRKHLQSYADGHINGNAIYKYDDPSYVDFLHEAFVQATGQCTWGDYDDKIWQYLYVSKPQLAHFFQQHELVAHCKAGAEWDPRMTLAEARMRYPASVLIHSQPLTSTQASANRLSTLTNSSTQ